jgi:CRISPR/Cas system-associated endonuclease/helicase Cas3
LRQFKNKVRKECESGEEVFGGCGPAGFKVSGESWWPYSDEVNFLEPWARLRERLRLHDYFLYLTQHFNFQLKKNNFNLIVEIFYLIFCIFLALFCFFVL